MKKCLLLTVLLFSLCYCTKDETEKDKPINFEYENIAVSIDLPIEQILIDQLTLSTFEYDTFPQNQAVTISLKRNCFNTVSLYKDTNLYAFIRIDPAIQSNAIISTETVGQSIVSLAFDFLTPGYDGTRFALDNAESSPHFQELMNILDSKWNANGISDLLYEPDFKTCLLSIMTDLLPNNNKKVNLTKEKRIFTTPYKTDESIAYCYITFPSIKLSGLDFTQLSTNQNKVKFNIVNSRRRQADVYIYKNDLQESTFALGGRVQSGLISTVISELVCPSTHDFELDFSGMAFRDSYCVSVIGPAWSFPCGTDLRYTSPWIRTMCINQCMPALTFAFDINIQITPGEFEQIKQLILDLYGWLQIGIDWNQILDQFKNRNTEDNGFFIDVANASVNTLYAVLQAPGTVEFIGANYFHYSGAALTSWTNRVLRDLGNFARWFQFFCMILEEIRVMEDYMNTAYRTDYYLINGISGQGDLQGTWQGLASNPADNWQSFGIYNHITPTYTETHGWGYYTKAGFCETVGYCNYNPITRQGDGHGSEFIKYQPKPGWCFSITSVGNFQVNETLDHLEGISTGAAPGDPCQAPGGTFYQDKIR